MQRQIAERTTPDVLRRKRIVGLPLGARAVVVTELVKSRAAVSKKAQPELLLLEPELDAVELPEVAGLGRVEAGRIVGDEEVHVEVGAVMSDSPDRGPGAERLGEVARNRALESHTGRQEH